MATQITADLPTLDFPREADYPTQEDWAAFSAAAEENFGILGGDWSTQMQLFKDQANAMSIESNNNANIAQSIANYQGDWVSKGYTLGQSVSVSGIYYICKLTHATGQNPTTGGSTYWNLALGNWYGNFGTGTQSFNGFGGSGFKNLILNGNKQVNQRGLTSKDNSYNYDMHYKAGNNWYLPIEGINLISGKKYTLSWVGVATASYYVGTATSSTINAQLFTFIANGASIIPTITTGQNLWIKFASNATGSTFNFVQLEEGSVATPFENRPYGLELSLCQRYFYNYISNLGRTPPFDKENNGATGVVAQGSNIAFRLTKMHPVAMRTTPSVSYNGLFEIFNGQENRLVTSVNYNDCSSTIYSMDWNIASAFTVTSGCVELLYQGSSISVSAEL